MQVLIALKWNKPLLKLKPMSMDSPVYVEYENLCYISTEQRKQASGAANS